MKSQTLRESKLKGKGENLCEYVRMYQNVVKIS